MDGVDEEVLEYLRWRQHAKPSEIADYLGVDPRVVRAALMRLRAKGLVIRTERGYALRPPDSTGGGEGVEAQPPQPPVPRPPPTPTLGGVTRGSTEALQELRGALEELRNAIDSLRGLPQSLAEALESVAEALEAVARGFEAVRLGYLDSLESAILELDRVARKIRRLAKAGGGVR